MLIGTETRCTHLLWAPDRRVMLGIKADKNRNRVYTLEQWSLIAESYGG